MRFYDVHSRFAEVHLRSRAERAVYFTLVAQVAESWSAVEVATLKGLDLGTVEAVLERYADAGIIEVVGSKVGLRYQWRSDMAYIFGASPGGPTMIDPVCGMTVTPWTPHRVEDRSKRLWLFCSSICLETFRADPLAYQSVRATPA